MLLGREGGLVGESLGIEGLEVGVVDILVAGVDESALALVGNTLVTAQLDHQSAQVEANGHHILAGG